MTSPTRSLSVLNFKAEVHKCTFLGNALVLCVFLFLQGNVVIADRNFLPDEPQLATDYESVSSEKSPVKKASVSLAVSMLLPYLITASKQS